jgi:exonuclease SbcD
VSELSEDLHSLIIPLAGREGKEKAFVGCLPYLHPHQVLSAAEGAGTSEDMRLSAYQSKVQDYFRALEDTIRRRDRQAVSVILTHADILGCEFGGGEWRSNVFSLNPGILPAHVHYVALGHIHKPQAVPGARAQARYAGSILQMDFGEREQRKSVGLIEAHPGKPAAVAEIPLTTGKWLLRRSGTAEAILAQAADFADAWVEVILQPDNRTVELVEQVRALPEVIALRFAEPQGGIGGIGESESRRTGDRPAKELFSDYYKIKRKTEPEPQLIALFERLYQEASTASDETL